MSEHPVLRSAIEHHRARRDAEADAAYRQHLAQHPGSAAAWNNFATLALDRHEWAAALERADRALALAPDHPILHCTRALALNGLGRASEAHGVCLWVLQSHRDCAEAWYGLGEAQARLGRNSEAIHALRTALRLKPSHVSAANRLGCLLSDAGDFEGALAACQTALQSAPASAAAHHNLGLALRMLGRHSEAIDILRRALALNPRESQVHSSLLVTMLSAPGTTAEMLAEESRRWWQQHGAPLWTPDRHFPNDPNPKRPLRIGYVSADFSQHPAGRHMYPLLREHDRRLYHVFAYSSVPAPDSLTARFRELEIEWRDVAQLSDDELARLVEADGIDILVDLSLHSSGDRLLVFARQPAPVQISFAGYPGETGLESIAWHLTDRVLEPADGAGTLHLPDSFWCMDPLEDCPEVNALPALSGAPLTFGCLHSFSKVNAGVIDLWCRILHAVPAARLVMLCPPGESRARSASAFRQHGIAPERVEATAFLPRRDYLALHHRIDVILDTFPYNGHMTALDALWMGVPFVTLTGELPVSRGGASILTQVGLTEPIARTPDEYVRIALALAGDLPRLAGLRASLRGRMKASPLMDGARFARNVETAWRAAWRGWCATPSTRRDTRV